MTLPRIKDESLTLSLFNNLDVIMIRKELDNGNGKTLSRQETIEYLIKMGVIAHRKRKDEQRKKTEIQN